RRGRGPRPQPVRPGHRPGRLRARRQGSPPRLDRRWLRLREAVMPPGRARESHGSFVDVAHIEVRAGKGGAGAVAFRREPFVPRGGPDGGDGGRGGSVVLFATPEASSLVAYVGRRELRAEDGRPGAGARKSGRTGADLRLPVPVGTLVVDEDAGAAVADL